MSKIGSRAFLFFFYFFRSTLKTRVKYNWTSRSFQKTKKLGIIFSSTILFYFVQTIGLRIRTNDEKTTEQPNRFYDKSHFVVYGETCALIALSTHNIPLSRGRREPSSLVNLYLHFTRSLAYLAHFIRQLRKEGTARKKNHLSFIPSSLSSSSYNIIIVCAHLFLIFFFLRALPRLPPTAFWVIITANGF